MIEMFNNDKIFIAPDIDINKLFDKGYSYEEIEKEIESLNEENPRNCVYKAADFRPEFKGELIKDAQFLTELITDWNKIPTDPKLTVFLQKLDRQFLNKEINVEGKLVIFSESKETVQYLKEALAQKGRTDVLAISSENRNDLHETIVANFDANYPPDKQENTYNIIITTEVLAEGVNLHRANVILHYDTPWNATRLMQRIGRVNRIGTKAAVIHNYVFYPSAQGDQQIELTKTAYMKIQAFHTAFGEDNQVYSENEILDETKLFSQEALQEESDQTLKHLYFLRDFKNKNKERFNQIKKIPLKSRIGRNALLANQPKRKAGTVVFIKNNKKRQFYWVPNTQNPQEINPVEALNIFEAKITEPSAPLTEHHYQQVNAAVTNFEALQEKKAAEHIAPEALGGVAKTAKKFLSDLIRHTSSETQKNTIQRLITLIDIGKYNKLPTEVTKIQKKKLPLPQALKAINELTAKYDYDTAYDNNQTQQNSTPADKTTLILSESFG
jgi:superfamily II DNA/RNA helicase